MFLQKFKILPEFLRVGGTSRRVYSVAIQSPAETSSLADSSAHEDSFSEEEEKQQTNTRSSRANPKSSRSKPDPAENKNKGSGVALDLPTQAQKKRSTSVPVLPSAAPLTSSFDLRSLRRALPSETKMSKFDPSMYTIRPCQQCPHMISYPFLFSFHSFNHV